MGWVCTSEGEEPSTAVEADGLCDQRHCKKGWQAPCCREQCWTKIALFASERGSILVEDR
jgi:hypothetical protein